MKKLSHHEGCYCRSDKSKANDSGNDHTDNLDSLEPGLSAPAHSLEHAPETVYEVEPESHEPNDIDSKYPPLSECSAKKEIWVIFELTYSKHLRKLHLGPEMGKVEEDYSKNDKTENKHILC